MTIGEKIKELRTERGWSQGELARRSGINRRVISRYELGHNEPTMSVIKRIANTLGVSIDYIVYNKPLENVINDKELLEVFKRAEKMQPQYRSLLKNVVDLMIFKDTTERNAK